MDSIEIPRPKNPNALDEIKQSRVNQGSFADRVYANIRVVDRTTGATTNKARVHVADIPVRTPFETYLVDGTHYQAKNQSQLKGTAYTRIEGSGDIASDFRLERGRNFKVMLDPETEKFIVKVRDSKFHLYPLLKALDTDDEEIRNRWGGQILTKNLVSEDSARKTLRKFAKNVFGERRVEGQNDDQVKNMVQNHFEVESHLNPEASNMTLGEPFARVNNNAILTATEKILNLHRGRVEPDHRDEIYYKRYRSLIDTGREYLDERAPVIQRRIKRRLERENIDEADLRGVFGSEIINPTVKSIFTRTKLQGAGETTNLLDLLSADSRVTVMGEHGISSEHRVTDPARDVRASSAGFIDPVKTPSGSAGVTEHLAVGTEIEGGQIRTGLIDAASGRRVKRTPEQLFGKVVAFPDEMEKTGGKWRPVRDRVQAVKDGRIVTVNASEVDFIIPSAVEMYSEVTNLIPFLSSNSGGRAIFGTSQITQAVPLVEREAPLVRANNFEASDAFSLGIKAPVDGKIVKITPDYIKIREKSTRNRRGKLRTVPLYNHLPLNQGSLLNSESSRTIGDSVTKGEILADNYFTRGGYWRLTGICPPPACLFIASLRRQNHHSRVHSMAISG